MTVTVNHRVLNKGRLPRLNWNLVIEKETWAQLTEMILWFLPDA